MLKALRRTKAPDIERAAGELPGFWPQFSVANQVVGGRNPLFARPVQRRTVASMSEGRFLWHVLTC